MKKQKKMNNQREFLLEVFKYEFSAKKTWYKNKYEELLKDNMGENKDEN